MQDRGLDAKKNRGPTLPEACPDVKEGRYVPAGPFEEAALIDGWSNGTAGPVDERDEPSRENVKVPPVRPHTQCSATAATDPKSSRQTSVHASVGRKEGRANPECLRTSAVARLRAFGRFKAFDASSHQLRTFPVNPNHPQSSSLDENRRAAEEKLRAKQGNANNNAAPTPKANSMSSQNTMKTPKSGGNANAGSSSNSAGSGLVQKSIMSFFKTPGAPASASASQQQQPAKTPSGPSASSTKPSPGPTRTPASASASTPSGVKPAFFKTPGSASASTSTALQSEDVDLTGDDDDVQVTGSGRPAASTSNRPASDSEEEEIIASSSRRLKRPAIPESSDEEAMSKSAANQKGKKKARQVASSSSESDEDYAVDESMSEAEEPVRKSGKGGGPSSTANKTPRTQSSLDQFRAPPKSTPGSSSKASNNNKPFSTPGLQPPSSAAKGKSSDETRYPWLETVRDAQGRTEEDPDYDQRTLHIPQSAWNKFTAFEKQYWEIKCKHVRWKERGKQRLIQQWLTSNPSRLFLPPHSGTPSSFSKRANSTNSTKKTPTSATANST